MNYRPYNKQALIAVMKYRNAQRFLGAEKKPSILDISKWPQWWESGAQELEKSAPGRVLTAPIRLPEAVLTSATKTVQQVPGIVRTVTKSIPLILVAAVVLGGGYLALKYSKGKKLIRGKQTT